MAQPPRVARVVPQKAKPEMTMPINNATPGNLPKGTESSTSQYDSQQPKGKTTPVLAAEKQMGGAGSPHGGLHPSAADGKRIPMGTRTRAKLENVTVSERRQTHGTDVLGSHFNELWASSVSENRTVVPEDGVLLKGYRFLFFLFSLFVSVQCSGRLWWARPFRSVRARTGQWKAMVLLLPAPGPFPPLSSL